MLASRTVPASDAPGASDADDACAGACTGFPDATLCTDIPGVHHVLPGLLTDHHAAALPDLPVPSLEATLKQYIASVEPLLRDAPDGEDALARVQGQVAEFLREGGRGRALHAALLSYAERDCGRGKPYPQTHWLERTWDQLAYLSDRAPLSLNVNCMGTLFQCTSTRRPLWRAGAVLHGLMRFKTAVDDGTLAPESLDGKGRSPLCMWQYRRLFSHTRVPIAADRCHWQSYPDSRHVAVQVQDRWYTFDLVRSDGSLLSTVDCVKELEVVQAMAEADRNSMVNKKGTPPPSIALMTSGKRDVWHHNRAAVQALHGPAAQTLEAIESAIFHVCLSAHAPADPVEMMNALCYGGTLGKDLWMDKSFGMVVYANGKVGFNMEHSHADAPMHSRMVEMMKHIVHTEGRKELSEWAAAQPLQQQNGRQNGGGHAMQSTVKRHSWCHGKELVENADFCLRMETALEFARQHIAGHRLALMDFRDFGKNTLKQFRVSPDSFVQCALQLAFWRDQGGRVTATYETGTTRAFYHGRTECIRPLTIASREMVGLMDRDSGATQQERHAALMASFKAHGAYLRKACVGMGIDRHLLAMRVIAMTAQQQDPNAEVPALFTDPAFEKMNTFELSTSAMPVTHYKDFLGFGAPFSFSYGCCYTMSSDKCLMTITGNASCEGKDVDRFKGHVEQAMRDLVQVLRDGSGAEVHAKL